MRQFALALAALVLLSQCACSRKTFLQTIDLL